MQVSLTDLRTPHAAPPLPCESSHPLNCAHGAPPIVLLSPQWLVQHVLAQQLTHDGVHQAVHLRGVARTVELQGWRG